MIPITASACTPSMPSVLSMAASKALANPPKPFILTSSGPPPASRRKEPNVDRSGKKGEIGFPNLLKLSEITYFHSTVTDFFINYKTNLAGKITFFAKKGATGV